MVLQRTPELRLSPLPVFLCKSRTYWSGVEILEFSQLLIDGEASEDKIPMVTLLEFDRRFSVFKEFVHYDFRSPTKLPGRGRATNTTPSLICHQIASKALMIVFYATRLSSAQIVRQKVCLGPDPTRLHVESDACSSRDHGTLALETKSRRCTDDGAAMDRVHWRENGGTDS